jgi:hypothetical protein
MRILHRRPFHFTRVCDYTENGDRWPSPHHLVALHLLTL